MVGEQVGWHNSDFNLPAHQVNIYLCSPTVTLPHFSDMKGRNRSHGISVLPSTGNHEQSDARVKAGGGFARVFARPLLRVPRLKSEHV